MSGSIFLPACGFKADNSDYQQAVQTIWRLAGQFPQAPAEQLRELVRYATLAPSSHNTQCWRFKLGDNSITILPDLQRRCPVVDPDDHHLFVSLGCATENLVQAAAAQGLHAQVSFVTGAQDAVEISLTPSAPQPSALFAAITQRQSSRVEYDGKPLANSELALLSDAASDPQVQLRLLTDKSAMDNVLAYVTQGNSAQLRDPAFVDELKHWIRFNEAEAIRTGDGLFSATTGNPTVPRWLGSPLFSLFLSEKSENDKYAKQVRSSAGIAVFITEQDDKAHWFAAGRAFERFALQATALGIRTAHLNQPVEVATLRPQFANYLGLQQGRPNLVIRFGHGPIMPKSLRRSVATVLV